MLLHPSNFKQERAIMKHQKEGSIPQSPGWTTLMDCDN